MDEQLGAVGSPPRLSVLGSFFSKVGGSVIVSWTDTVVAEKLPQLYSGKESLLHANCMA